MTNRMQLYIGNKNYSSWSMRPWVLMAQLDIPFVEQKLREDPAGCELSEPTPEAHQLCTLMLKRAKSYSSDHATPTAQAALSRGDRVAVLARTVDPALAATLGTNALCLAADVAVVADRLTRESGTAVPVEVGRQARDRLSTALADAAGELGRNINRAPLDEGGPLEVARAALDAVGKRALAMGAGADAQIVAKGPVIAVVRGGATGLGVCRGFVLRVAGGGQL